MKRANALSPQRSLKHQPQMMAKKMPAQVPRRASLSMNSCTIKDCRRQQSKTKRQRRSNGRRPSTSASSHLKSTRLIWEGLRIRSLQNPSRNLENAWQMPSIWSYSKELQALSTPILTQEKLRTKTIAWSWVARGQESHSILVQVETHRIQASKRSIVWKWRLSLAIRPTKWRSSLTLTWSRLRSSSLRRRACLQKWRNSCTRKFLPAIKKTLETEQTGKDSWNKPRIFKEKVYICMLVDGEPIFLNIKRN